MTDSLFERVARAVGERYTLERELGHGGMATVYLARDNTLGRQVAVKVLLPELRQVLGSERFQREVRLAAQLSHPHIVPVFEAGEADGVLFYAMGYVEGESLHQRLQREGPLPLDEALRLIGEVAEALQYAHERGILHRDIKPANILLSRGHALVADFGIAKATAGETDQPTLTATGVSVGTVEYMSPEQAGGEAHLDARSDVYALGVLLYEMLVGEPPFRGTTAQAVVARILADPPRPLRTVRPSVPVAVEAAVLAALSKLPADRPPTAAAFVLGLARSPAALPRRSRARLVSWLVIALVALAAYIAWRGEHAAPVAMHPVGMVLVPGGRYLVGGGPGRPVVAVTLDPFYIDSTEVTVAAYRRYLDSTAASVPWADSPPSDWPVTRILWREANDYCRWRGSRLPTTDEWEAAARGPKGWQYPWGNAWEGGRANAESAADTLRAVGSFPSGRSSAGAMDMVGNAWEWVSTERMGPGGEVRHLIKGGAFNSRREIAAPANSVAFPDDRRQLWLTGFRCARAATR